MKSLKENYQFLKKYKLGNFIKPNFVNVPVTIFLIVVFIIKNRKTPFDFPFLILILMYIIGIYLIVSVSYDIIKQYLKNKVLR